MKSAKTLGDLKKVIIKDGIESVRLDERLDEHEKRGSVYGFELCQTLEDMEDFEKAISDRRQLEARMTNLVFKKKVSSQSYWEYRYATIQIEWVYEIFKVALGYSEVSARAAIQYARLFKKI